MNPLKAKRQTDINFKDNLICKLGHRITDAAGDTGNERSVLVNLDDLKNCIVNMTELPVFDLAVELTQVTVDKLKAAGVYSVSGILTPLESNEFFHNSGTRPSRDKAVAADSR